MFWKLLSLSYTIKNYQKYMDVGKIVTLRGIIMRTTRKYPKTYNFIKKSSLMFIFSSILLYLIPNSSLPMQK